MEVNLLCASHFLTLYIYLFLYFDASYLSADKKNQDFTKKIQNFLQKTSIFYAFFLRKILLPKYQILAKIGNQEDLS